MAQKILDIVFPKICGHCGSSFKDGLSNVLCRECFDAVSPYEDPVCGHCGMSLPPRAFEGADKIRCRDCGDDEYFLDEVRSFGAYAGALRLAHHSFKFEGMESLCGAISEKMIAAWPRDCWNDIQALVPVPQSPERERERGYNPAVHLTHEISKLNQVPVKALLRKVRSTQPQMSLKREERLKNPKGAYERVVKEQVPEKVLLVDDVFTTGSTLEECAKVLKKSGARWVGALVFGRTHRY